MNHGLIHIYTGDGKGKTTSAIGLCARAAGQGMKVCVVQFLKTANTGEIKLLEKEEKIEFYRTDFKGGFVWELNEKQKKELCEKTSSLWEKSKILASSCDLIILDEIIGAIHCGFINPEDVAMFLKNKPKTTEIVLTGRNAPKELIELSDYVSEIIAIKHPFEKGIEARRGIEL